jgi:FAD-dependent halogenase
MTQVLIVGGGPAGSAAARLLALWGHRVRLVSAPPSHAASTLAESIPPSCGKLFDVLGVREDVDRQGFVRSTGNTVWWGNEDGRIESFAAGERGWQVTSAELGRALLDCARYAGVRVEHARVSAEEVAAARESVVLDCSGRSGVVARATGWRVYEPALKTVALVGRWRRDDPWPIPDQTHTIIESYPGGWVWSVPARDGSRYIAAMVDPRASDLSDAAPREIYQDEIVKAWGFSTLVAGARLEEGPRGWDASMYSSTRFADDRTLLVGDAGSFIDPLSSAGVKKALASGWLAAVAAHTAIARPAMRHIAFEFFEAREREMYHHLRELTQRFLADAAGGHSGPFWSDRIGLSGDDRTGNDDHAEVMKEFERLRSAPELAVRRGDGVRVEARPAVSGCEIVLEERVVTDDCPQGCRYSHDVDLVELVQMAPGVNDAGRLFEAYLQRAPAVSLPDFLAALSTALACGWLMWSEGGRGAQGDQGDQ